MNGIPHTRGGHTALEIHADGIVLQTEQDTIRLMEELYEHSASSLILHRENIAPEFFNLRTRLAGELLQKFVNYRVRVAIIGDFAHETSDALKAFIYESNRGSSVFFVESVEAALLKLT